MASCFSPRNFGGSVLRIKTRLKSDVQVITLFFIDQWVSIGPGISESCKTWYEAGQQHLTLCKRILSQQVETVEETIIIAEPLGETEN